MRRAADPAALLAILLLGLLVLLATAVPASHGWEYNGN